jgi:hypothetical protein
MFRLTQQEFRTLRSQSAHHAPFQQHFEGYSMKPGQKLILTMVGFLVLTPLSILATLGFDIVGVEMFHKWPWFRISVLMTAFTTLSAFVGAAGVDSQHSPAGGTEELALLYGAAAVPCLFLLLAPRLEHIGLSSFPGAWFLLFSWGVIHGVGFYIIRKGRPYTDSP